MRAGRLKKVVYVDRPVDTQDATGDAVRTWQTVGTFWWAGVEPLTAREFGDGQAIRGEMDTKFIFRHSIALDGMDETYRIRYASKIFNIVSVIEKNMGKRELEVMAKSGRNEG